MISIKLESSALHNERHAHHRDGTPQDLGKQVHSSQQGSPLEWLDRKVKREEGDADEERNEDPCLLGFLSDRQNPPRQRQLAAHFKRLPPEP